MSDGRKPDYFVGALDKISGIKTSRVGAAWAKEDGSITIKLNAFTVLDCTRMDIILTLFPADNSHRKGSKASAIPYDDSVFDNAIDADRPY